MIARGIANASSLQAAAESIGVRVEATPINQKGTAFRFTLKLGDKKRYQRVSPTMRNKDGSPRRVAAVCWHGHAAFFRALFKLEPDAVVSSSRMGAIRYTAANFEDVYPATGDWNIGSAFAPMAFRDACDYDTHPVNR